MTGLAMTGAHGRRDGGFARPDFTRFLNAESAGAIVLLLATVIALLAANSPLYPAWESFWPKHADLSAGSWSLSMSLENWVSDGLMAFFFFDVGMEIK